MKSRFFSLLIILAVLSGTGCWDTRDIGDKAFITAVGLDAVEKSGIRENRGDPGGFPQQIKLTVEILKPGLLRLAGRREPASLVRTVTADSIDTALEKLQTGLAREESLTHLMVLLVGEKMARQNFKDISSYFEKSPEVARRVRVMFVQNGEAADLLKTKPEFERYVAAELSEIAEMGERLPLTRNEPFSDLERDLTTTNGRALGVRVYTVDNGQAVERSGGAVFNKWKLAGWLSASETRDANWLVDGSAGPVLGDTGKGVYTYNVNNSSVSIKPVTEKGKLRFRVKIKTTGIIMQENGKYVEMTEPEEVEKMEKVFARTITKQIEAALRKAQKELRIDYLDFGTILKRSKPEIAEKLDWDKTFPNVPVDIEVKTTVNLIALSR